MIAILAMIVAAVAFPVALIGVVSLYMDALDNARDDIVESDRAASMAEFQTLHSRND